MAQFWFFCIKIIVMSYDVIYVTSWRHWRHVMTSHDVMISYYRLRFVYLITEIRKPWKSQFLTWWPWPLTLTIKLIWEVIKVNPYTKFCDCMLIGSAVRVFTNWHTHTHTQTDRQTDRSVFITSTADAGGKNVSNVSQWLRVHTEIGGAVLHRIPV